MIYWKRPPGRASSFRVKCYDEDNNVLFDKGTNETQYLLKGDELQCSSVEVYSISYVLIQSCDHTFMMTGVLSSESSSK